MVSVEERPTEASNLPLSDKPVTLSFKGGAGFSLQELKERPLSENNLGRVPIKHALVIDVSLIRGLMTGYRTYRAWLPTHARWTHPQRQKASTC